jgi:RNA polymerase sigma-70 factor (ECF subfamily)
MGSGEPTGEGERVVTYCVVPRELAAKVHEPLRAHFRDDHEVEVVVERRRAERRAAGDRRETDPAGGADRRRIRNVAGRRVADRRATAPPVDGPEALPRRVRHYSDRLRWVERIEPSSEQLADIDSARLVIRFQSGDRAAFENLYLRYFNPVYSYLRVLFGHDTHSAEDVAQQAFTKVFAALPRYERRRQPFRAWLFTVVRNEALSQLQRSARSEITDPTRLARQLDDAGASPAHAETLEWLTDRELMLFVERLPLAQRQVLVMRYMLDLSMNDIAEILGRNLDDVRQLDFRARKFLESRLAAIGRDPRGPRLSNQWHRRRSRAPVTRMRRYALSSR